MTKDKFQREERYIVFNLSDVEEHFTPNEKQHLERLVEVQRACREEACKSPLDCVVVESDWPEYEPTWKAIEARVTGAQPAPSLASGDVSLISEGKTQPAPTIPEAVMEVIASLVYEVERNICPHEETQRGGQWEICDMCGAKWADNRGGKPEFKWPEVVEKARAMLEAAPEAKP